MKFLDKEKLKTESGFSLVELLTVIAIIGILATIAIPQFSKYKDRSYDTAAKSDLYNLYSTCMNHWTEKTNSDPCSLSVASEASYGFISSNGVTVTIDDESHNGFHATSVHASSNKTYEIGPEGYISYQ